MTVEKIFESMFSDRVSNPVSLALRSDALSIAPYDSGEQERNQGLTL